MKPIQITFITLVLTQFLFAQNPAVYTAEMTSDRSASFNLKNTEGFWHMSGPRSYEANNNFSIFWNDGSYKRLLTILDNGRVGIGTENPKNVFEIGNAYSFHSGGHKVLGLGYAPGGNGTSLLNGYVSEIRLDPANGRLRFGISNQSYTKGQNPLSLITAMTINNNGSVGIGTLTTGSHRLAVEGSIGARAIEVEASGWSDFVFEKDYKLRTLEEVENYIEENKHLPEIPTEKEVMEQGIDLAKMNAKLLQKIEELTLYLIEEHKNNLKLQKELEELEDRFSVLENTKK